MQKAYETWLCLENIHRKLFDKVPSGKPAIELTNILERFYISSFDSQFNIRNCQVQLSKLQSEIDEKPKIFRKVPGFSIFCRNVIEVHLDKLNASIDAGLYIDNEECFVGTVNVKYKKFLTFVHLEKKKRLLRNNENYEELTQLLIQHHCINLGHQNWMIPLGAYKKLQSRYSVDIEGFATPIHSQLAKLGREYCSIFDIDKKFGSLGSFFDLKQKDDMRIVVNPPFIESIIDKTEKKIVEFISGKKCLFIVLLPTWTDMKSIQNLISLATKRQNLEKGKYHLENTKGQRFTAYFNAILLFIANYDISCFDLSDISF